MVGQEVFGLGNKEIKLSVVIPSFNAVSTIEASLKSLQYQTCQDFEIIVIDGGSTDGTVDILNGYKNIISDLVIEKDSGIYDAMNKGIARANGSFIYFLGADDTLQDERVFERVLPLLKQKAVYYGQAYFVKRQKIYDGKFSFYKLALRNICHQAIFYPTDILRRVRFNMTYPLLSDYHLNLRLIGEKTPFIYIKHIVAVFNDSASSATRTDTAFEQDKLSLIKKNLGFLPYLYASLRRTIKKVITSE